MILGNSILQWTIAIATFAVSFVLLKTIQNNSTHHLQSMANKTESKWNDRIAEILAETKLAFLAAFAIIISSLLLEMPDYIRQLINKAFVIVLLIQAGLWSNFLIARSLNNYQQRIQSEGSTSIAAVNIIGIAAKLVLWSALLLFALDNIGINITSLVAGLGIGGVAVALAVQNILGDLFSSLSIVLDKPFVKGDFLIVGEFLGSVENVGLKTTRLRSLSGEQLVFSNSDLLNSRIRNYGRMFERRVVFTIGVTYQTPHKLLKLIPEILQSAVENQEQTRFDRAHFMKYGEYSLIFETVYYVLSSNYNTYMDIQQAINLDINERFETANIQFAYPTQSLFIFQREETLDTIGSDEDRIQKPA